jgi:hypothetical protein
MVKRVKVTLPTETTEKPIAAPTDVPQYDCSRRPISWRPPLAAFSKIRS